MSRVHGYLLLEAGNRVYRCQLTRDLLTFGSAPGNDIIIRDDLVLARHAQISHAAGVFTLRPLDDAEVRQNGAIVRGPVSLEHADRITLGDTEMLFARDLLEAPCATWLVIRRPGEPGSAYATRRQVLTIGRDHGELSLQDPAIARSQCQIETYAPGATYVVDTRSERGTFVNDERIDARRRLSDGDVIRIGNTKLIYCETVTAVAARLGLAAQASSSAFHERAGEVAASPWGFGGKRLRRGIDTGVQTGLVPEGPPERSPYATVAATSASSVGWQEPRAPQPAPQRSPVGSRPPSRAAVDARAAAPTRDPRLDNSGLWYLPGRSAPRPAPGSPATEDAEATIALPKRPRPPEAPAATRRPPSHDTVIHSTQPAPLSPAHGHWYLPEGSRKRP